MAANVKRLRLDRAWSQEELATASDLNVRTIQGIENGSQSLFGKVGYPCLVR